MIILGHFVGLHNTPQTEMTKITIIATISSTKPCYPMGDQSTGQQSHYLDGGSLKHHLSQAENNDYYGPTTEWTENVSRKNDVRL